MPAGPIAPGPVIDASQFANDVGGALNIDPRVIFSQEKIEGAYAAGGTGGFNFLNLRASTVNSLGKPYAGSSPAGFAQFSSLKQAEDATIAEFQSPAIAVHGYPGDTPAQQISRISASPWDAGHYGNGKSLTNAFTQTYGVAALTRPTSTNKVSPASGTPGQTAAGVPNPVSGITDAIGSITDAFKFIFSYRFLEILGGGLLLLLGLYLLAQQFRQTFPIPLPKTATDPFQQGAATQERSESRSVGKREVRRRVAGTSATQEANLAGARADRATANL
jgi:hypothetical protein